MDGNKKQNNTIYMYDKIIVTIMKSETFSGAKMNNIENKGITNLYLLTSRA